MFLNIKSQHPQNIISMDIERFYNVFSALYLHFAMYNSTFLRYWFNICMLEYL